MFKPPEDRSWGEEPRLPRREFTPSHRGYPAKRDPAADGRQGSSLSNIGAAGENKLRKKYGSTKILSI